MKQLVFIVALVFSINLVYSQNNTPTLSIGTKVVSIEKESKKAAIKDEKKPELMIAYKKEDNSLPISNNKETPALMDASKKEK